MTSEPDVFRLGSISPVHDTWTHSSCVIFFTICDTNPSNIILSSPRTQFDSSITRPGTWVVSMSHCILHIKAMLDCGVVKPWCSLDCERTGFRRALRDQVFVSVWTITGFRWSVVNPHASEDTFSRAGGHSRATTQARLQILSSVACRFLVLIELEDNWNWPMRVFFGGCRKCKALNELTGRRPNDWWK